MEDRFCDIIQIRKPAKAEMPMTMHTSSACRKHTSFFLTRQGENNSIPLTLLSTTRYRTKMTSRPLARSSKPSDLYSRAMVASPRSSQYPNWEMKRAPGKKLRIFTTSGSASTHGERLSIRMMTKQTPTSKLKSSFVSNRSNQVTAEMINVM